jgi:N-acetylneuraminic acid mutarotase
VNGIGAAYDVNPPGNVYGAQGSFAPGNLPTGRGNPAVWMDHSGKIWLFSGAEAGVDGNVVTNDLWEFDPSINEWAWIGGNVDPAKSSAGVYGTMGVAAPGNIPGERAGAAHWVDKSGNLWLYGGGGLDSQGNSGCLSDMWEYSPSASAWTWAAGDRLVSVGLPIYGTLGTPGPTTYPDCHGNAVSWTDASGKLWMFGGDGFDENQDPAEFGDLWEFDPSTKLWTWMGGSNQPNALGVYGTMGTPSKTNIPGARDSAGVAVDTNGLVWLFGGNGFAETSNGAQGIYGAGSLNDLWEYDPSTGEWTWISGSTAPTPSGTEVPGVYGTLGVPAAGNTPGPRSEFAMWADAQGNPWVFGGDEEGEDEDDLWVFDVSTKQWGWMGGSSISLVGNVAENGVYGTLGEPAIANYLSARAYPGYWADAQGNLWLFSGTLYNDLWVFEPTLTPTFPKAADPVISPAPGTYSKAENGIAATITDSTPGAVILYTADGTTPTQSSDAYSGLAIFVGNPSQTIKAVAIAPQYLNSEVVSATYYIGATSTMSVTPSASSILSNAAATVTTSVAGASGQPMPTGTVTLTSGSYTSSAVSLAAGTATTSIPAGSLATGSDTLTAAYSGDAIYGGNIASAAITVTPAPNFSMTGPAITVIPGATTGNTSTITITPSGSFTGAIALNAAITSSPAGASSLPTLSFGSTTPANVSGTSAATATLTISTTASSGCQAVNGAHSPQLWKAIPTVAFGCLVLAGFSKRRRAWQKWIGGLLLLFALTFGISACGSGSSASTCSTVSSGTTTGAYTITVTGTSGSLSNTATLSLTVQ